MSVLCSQQIADIGNAYTPYGIHCAWGVLLAEEFVTQGQAELDAGREPGVLKHPSKPGVDDPTNQVAFFNVIAMPPVKAWAFVFSSSGNVLVGQASNNLAHWENLACPQPKSMKTPPSGRSSFAGLRFEVQRSSASSVLTGRDNSVSSRSVRFLSSFNMPNAKASEGSNKGNNNNNNNQQ